MKRKVFCLLLSVVLCNAAAAYAEDIVVWCKDGEAFVIPSESYGYDACRDHGGVDFYGTMK